MTTIIVPTWLAWTLAILVGFPFAIIGLLCLFLVIVGIVSFFKDDSKVPPIQE